MRAFATTIFVAASLTACSIPEKQLIAPDAPVVFSDPLGCINAPPPSVAKDPVTISGTLSDPFQPQIPIAGAPIELFVDGVATQVVTATSDATGHFTQQQGFNGVAHKVYLVASFNGYLDSYFYPAAKLSDKIDEAIQMLTADELNTVASAGMVTLDPTTNTTTLFVSVVDCNGKALAGATVSSDPPGTVVYIDASVPSRSAVATDSITGSAMIANIPVSHTTIHAMFNGKAFLDNTFDGVKGALMQAEIQP